MKFRKLHEKNGFVNGFIYVFHFYDIRIFRLSSQYAKSPDYINLTHGYSITFIISDISEPYTYEEKSITIYITVQLSITFRGIDKAVLLCAVFSNFQ